MTNIARERPLSPHLQIYKPQITSVLSITHRATGVFLSLGIPVLVAWLWAAAHSPVYYALWMTWMGTLIGKLLLGAWSFAFYYHLANGIRHLFWDMGKGFDLPSATKSGWMVVLFAFSMTGVSWWFVLCNMGRM